MIHVQIASEVTADGVRGARWVLLEAAEPPPSDAVDTRATAVAAPAVASQSSGPAPASMGRDSVADGLRLRVLKALVMVLGLGAALWTAAVQIGPPAPAATPHVLPVLPPPAAPAPVPTVPASAVVPQSAADTPAVPASAGLPRLTALL